MIIHLLIGICECIHVCVLVQANPDQSKHLETANIHLDLTALGGISYSLDCVNLRAETYAGMRVQGYYSCVKELVCMVV